MSEELHVIFGAGQVGPHLAERLQASGRRVRVVKRSPEGSRRAPRSSPGPFTTA